MKKYIFLNDNTEDFVCFEGHEQEGFWEGKNKIRYCHTDLNLALANEYAKRNIVIKKEIDSTEEEYLMYDKEGKKHEEEMEEKIRVGNF